MNNNNSTSKTTLYPRVSVCTPTFNRRPFIPYLIKCFEHQTYPKEKIEWIIIDDGTDKVEDLFLPLTESKLYNSDQKYIVKYFKYDKKMTLGKKRNLAHDKCTGDIIIYMDDDDYYPPERITHAVETLQNNPNALCAGSSLMYIYFKHINKMYKFGPYGPNHSTAATFAFRKELLKETGFDNDACLAEEKKFLKNYTIPFVQLEPMKTILVFSHNHNSFDKKILLNDLPNQYVNKSNVKVEEFVKEKDIMQFFMNDIDNLLDLYEPGKPEHKPDVVKQMNEIKEKREKIIKEQNKKIKINAKFLNSNFNTNGSANINTNKVNEITMLLNEVLMENNQLKDKVKYLEEKIKKIIIQQIEERKKFNSNLN
jgi:glycosyltransferase involved in cell wall biosynthesis